MPEVRGYTDHRGRRPFYIWLEKMSLPVQRRILRIVARMEQGNLGDVRGVGEGVVERRADFGPGYRIYFAWDGPMLIILLGGGDKSSQRRDIAIAKARWGEYQNP